MGLAVGQCMVSMVWYMLYSWCDTGGGGGWGPGCLSGAGLPFGCPGLPGASVVDVGAVLLLLLPLGSGCNLMLFFRLHVGLLDAVCCFVSAAPVRVGCFLPLPAALGLLVSRCCLCC